MDYTSLQMAELVVKTLSGAAMAISVIRSRQDSGKSAKPNGKALTGRVPEPSSKTSPRPSWEVSAAFREVYGASLF
jgi:hypothetical protein